MMKYYLLCFLLACYVATAENVDVTSSSALVSTQNTNDGQSINQAWLNLISKYTGVSIDRLRNLKLLQRFDTKKSILRSYHKKIPYSNDMYWFNISVDAHFLKQLVIRENLSIWPPKRKTVYLWLVEEDEKGVFFSSEQSETMYWLKNWFDIQGVPLNYINPSEIAGLDFSPDTIKNLSYEPVKVINELHPDASVLMMTVKHHSGGYSYRLGFASGGKPLQIRHQQFTDLFQGLRDASEFVKNTAVGGETVRAVDFSEYTFPMVVNGVVDYNEVSKVFSYLEEHFLVRAVELTGFDKTQLIFRLSIQSKPDVFIKMVQDDGFIRHQPEQSLNQHVFTFDR